MNISYLCCNNFKLSEDQLMYFILTQQVVQDYILEEVVAVVTLTKVSVYIKAGLAAVKSLREAQGCSRGEV